MVPVAVRGGRRILLVIVVQLLMLLLRRLLQLQLLFFIQIGCDIRCVILQFRWRQLTLQQLLLMRAQLVCGAGSTAGCTVLLLLLLVVLLHGLKVGFALLLLHQLMRRMRMR